MSEHHIAAVKAKVYLAAAALGFLILMVAP